MGTSEEKLTPNQQHQAWFQQQQADEPKATQGIFELPCGYLAPDGQLIIDAQVREITGAEEDLLAAHNISGGRKITQLIGNCLERLGPVADRALLVRLAQELPVGDRIFLTFAIRRVTLGDTFPYEETCPKCGAKNNYATDLSTLDVKKPADPKARIHECRLPSGKSVRWHVMTGRDEEALARLDAKDVVSGAIFVRLEQIDGSPVELESVKALSMRDRTFLREEFEAKEGGIETSVEVECPSCGYAFSADINPGSTGFFFPSRLQKNSKRNTSST